MINGWSTAMLNTRDYGVKIMMMKKNEYEKIISTISKIFLVYTGQYHDLKSTIIKWTNLRIQSNKNTKISQ